MILCNRVYRSVVIAALAVFFLHFAPSGALAQSFAAKPVAITPASTLESGAVYDPYESFNRKIYKFNNVVDKYLLRPVAKTYVKAVPTWGRARIGSFLRNLATPITFFNALFQRDVDYAFTAFWRFTINSTIGIGGLFDFATDAGLKDRVEDFGQTAALYGVRSGPYIMLPILGPSNARDTFGRIVDIFIDPFNYILTDEELVALYATRLVHYRADALDFTDSVEKTSLDSYATYRSLYVQNRQSLVRNGAVDSTVYQELPTN